jgi:hypothetical protein
MNTFFPQLLFSSLSLLLEESASVEIISDPYLI